MARTKKDALKDAGYDVDEKSREAEAMKRGAESRGADFTGYRDPAEAAIQAADNSAPGSGGWSPDEELTGEGFNPPDETGKGWTPAREPAAEEVLQENDDIVRPTSGGE